MSQAKSHLKAYLTVYFSLLVLVVVTVGVAHIDMGALSFPIAMGVAVLKTVLIVTIFMHLSDEAPLVRIFAASGAFWLFLLFAFMMGDYITRHETQRLVPRSVYLEAIETGSHQPGHHVESQHASDSSESSKEY